MHPGRSFCIGDHIQFRNVPFGTSGDWWLPYFSRCGIIFLIILKRKVNEMIRFIRMLSIVLAIISAVVYGGASIYARTNTDRNGPQIQVEEKEISVSIDAGEEALLKGITAEDKKDGDVTDSLIVESVGAFIEKGKRPVSVAAFDSDNNVAKATRIITYTDYVSPQIVLTKPLRAPVNSVNELTEGITVTDCLEGDITDNVQITLAEDGQKLNMPGEYAMKLMVSNNAGDIVELPVTVELYDYTAEGTKPRALLSQYLVYTKAGEPINPSDYLVGVSVRGREYRWDLDSESVPVSRSQVTVNDSVDYNTPGVYEISYEVYDSGTVGIVRLVVVVEE